ncbi:Tfp pilus assembly protein FimT/FimU [Cystobacter fuscus]|uniref:pilus assembly FimT family protein n=1 Tax=Cystobacter fuscus TaxID=43 RepID=UPI002B286EC8|nr:prepilin-type N-terminal cleavage/methylation domain-containing protein [Cystobacter fuscus]
MKRTRRNTGFSLLELMTVVGIIGILAALSLAALEVLPQRTRLTGGALEFAAVISSARSQAYGRNQRVAVLINAATQNIGQPIRYWVVVDKWSDFANALSNTPGWTGLNDLKPTSPSKTDDSFMMYDSGYFNASVRVYPPGFSGAVNGMASPSCNKAEYADIRLARGQPSNSDDIFPAPYCFVPSNSGCTFCSGDGVAQPMRGVIFFEPDGSVRFANAAGTLSNVGAASITFRPTNSGLENVQAVVITNTGLVRTFSASTR